MSNSGAAIVTPAQLVVSVQLTAYKPGTPTPNEFVSERMVAPNAAAAMATPAIKHKIFFSTHILLIFAFRTEQILAWKLHNPITGKY
jgi:hypothetical protein